MAIWVELCNWLLMHIFLSLRLPRAQPLTATLLDVAAVTSTNAAALAATALIATLRLHRHVRVRQQPHL